MGDSIEQQELVSVQAHDHNLLKMPYLRDRAVVAAAFVLSRLIAFGLGVRFDAGTVETHWQFLDGRLLESDLGASLWNLHCQPPLMNAFYGIVAKLSPADRGTALAWILFALLGLAAALLVYELASRFGNRRVACIVACVFTLNPAAILFENVLFYPHLVMVLFCVAAFALDRAIGDKGKRWMFVFFALVALIALTRSTYHLVWVFALATAVVALATPEVRRTATLAAILAIVAVGAWYAKNLALVGQFSASTWMGMSLGKFTSNAVGESVIERHIQDGSVTPIFSIPPFSPLDEYSRFVTPTAGGHPALTAIRKTNGASNYNNFAYVEVSDRYLRDALVVIRAEPAMAFEGQIDSWGTYFQPSSQYHHFIGAVFSRTGYHQTNVVALAPYEAFWNGTVGLQLGNPPADGELLSYAKPAFRTRRIASVSWTSVVGTLAIALLVPMSILCNRRTGRYDRRQVALAAFCIANVLFAAIVGNAIEVGENQRFRFETEALWWILVAMLASRAVGAAVGSSRKISPDSDVSSSATNPAG